MEQIGRMIGIMCVSIMIVSVVTDLGGFPSSEKVIKFISAVYVVYVLLKNFGNVQLEFDTKQQIYNTDMYGNAEYFKDTIVETTEEQIENIVAERLSEKNISYNSIYLHILEQDNNLTVDKIIIDCDSKNEKAVKECLYDIVSEKTEVYIGE